MQFIDRRNGIVRALFVPEVKGRRVRRVNDVIVVTWADL